MKNEKHFLNTFKEVIQNITKYAYYQKRFFLILYI